MKPVAFLLLFKSPANPEAQNRAPPRCRRRRPGSETRVPALNRGSEEAEFQAGPPGLRPLEAVGSGSAEVPRSGCPGRAWPRSTPRNSPRLRGWCRNVFEVAGISPPLTGRRCVHTGRSLLPGLRERVLCMGRWPETMRPLSAALAVRCLHVRLSSGAPPPL